MALDQIYSLLGLCSPEEVAGNPIRYDLEPEEVNESFAATHKRLHNNLEFLGLCTAVQRDALCSGSMDKLISRPFAGPSWVPNWHSQCLQRCLGLNDYNTDLKSFNASDGILMTVSFQGNELGVSVPLPVDIPDMFCRWCRGSSLDRQLAEFRLKPKNATDMEGERVFMGAKRLMPWEPFITGRGYIGLAREQSRVGNEIWLVGGCSVPLLLSPQTENPGFFEVNGEVFLDGFMFGEAMRWTNLGFPR
ncbi:uncharacterized protein TRIVIDRAFT_60299 [Trichoderma virens Gv29-8]|uniref:Heterokaryon incompatibility domain-containing protein n=1 Tax=Hypocrea virens (strain Gv29-8 / FGSC 10586) TaxID=413071 RepID=G9MS13_HYPVG|nr:uncharacterized protein TRIVIDRAFT_60299 [Trichoderma virens Gv29-8]EHK22880.1 hypothetical protein TRIVIDRAFT_60299 [Trichoderma virens Gv29-8]UKZ47931.1 hypothetical protein TrVGV298_002166 [Trichoderma virens]